MISFSIPGEPVPKGRPKFRVVWAKDLVIIIFKMVRGGVALCEVADYLKSSLTTMAYTPPKTKVAEEAFAWQAAKFKPHALLAGALRVDTIFVVTAPQKFPADRSREWPHVKPDDDNYRKLVLDAINGMFWHDDSQICGGESFKIYGAPARTFVRIRPLTIDDAVAVRRMIGDADDTQTRFI